MQLLTILIKLYCAISLLLLNLLSTTTWQFTIMQKARKNRVKSFIFDQVITVKIEGNFMATIDHGLHKLRILMVRLPESISCPWVRKLLVSRTVSQKKAQLCLEDHSIHSNVNHMLERKPFQFLFWGKSRAPTRVLSNFMCVMCF